MMSFLSSCAGKSYGVDVVWMDSTAEEAHLWQRMLCSDGEWVEDVLPLRMLMMAKGMSKWEWIYISHTVNGGGGSVFDLLKVMITVWYVQFVTLKLWFIIIIIIIITEVGHRIDCIIKYDNGFDQNIYLIWTLMIIILLLYNLIPASKASICNKENINELSGKVNVSK